MTLTSNYTTLKYYVDMLKTIENNSINSFLVFLVHFHLIKNQFYVIMNHVYWIHKKYTNTIRWTLVCINKIKNKIYFYDSFGRSYKKLSPLWKNKKWVNSHDDGQCLFESNCGQHCLAFILAFISFKEKCLNIL